MEEPFEAIGKYCYDLLKGHKMGQLIDKLRQNYQVITVSTRGHGRSEIGQLPLTYEQKANDMLAVMKAVTKEPAILLGFSDGAYTAYKVVSMYPERVDRVIAIGAGTLKKGFFSGEMKVEDLAQIDAKFIKQQKKNHARAGTLSGVLHQLHEVLESDGSRRRLSKDHNVSGTAYCRG